MYEGVMVQYQHGKNITAYGLTKVLPKELPKEKLREIRDKLPLQDVTVMIGRHGHMSCQLSNVFVCGMRGA
eukprot:6648036-Prorocentrum_lima.AAC.1